MDFNWNIKSKLRLIISITACNGLICYFYNYAILFMNIVLIIIDKLNRIKLSMYSNNLKCNNQAFLNSC